jgi:hypothetical protein
VADKPVADVVLADAALDALEDPTSSDVYEALQPFSNDAGIAVAASRALSGGGGGGTGLPTGWTQGGDPASVDANGGALDGLYTLGSASMFVGGILDSPALKAGVGDPTSGGGVAANVGSLYMRTNGQLWVKTGAGNTAWTQAGGVPAAAVQIVRVPLAFDDTAITPFTVYIPSTGEAVIWNLSYLSVTEAFDGTSPNLALTFTDFAGSFTSFGLDTADSASADGHTLTPISTLDISSNVGVFPDTDPLLGILSDGAGGDPNDPDSMTAGAAEIVLVILGA